MVAKFSKFRKTEKSIFENVVAVGVFMVLVTGVIGFFLFQNIKIGQKRGELEETLQVLQAQAGRLQAQKEELEEDVADTQTEEYQEKILREQGLYKKRGEEVVTVLPQEEPAAAAVEGQETKARVWWKPWTW